MRIGVPDSSHSRAENHTSCNRLLISSGLSEFKDAVSLKKDGRRVSLEGVLTGAALGIVLLYLVEDAVAAVSGPPIGGPLQDPGDGEPGSLGATAGRIEIRPLQDLGLAFDDIRPQGFGMGSSGGGLAEIGGRGGRGPVAEDGPSSQESSRPLDVIASFGGGGGGGGWDGGGSSNPDVPPIPPGPPTPGTEPLPQLMLVVVRTFGGAGSRSLEGRAGSSQNAIQVGIENTSMDLRQSGAPAMELRSQRTLQSFAISGLDDADLNMIAEHIGLVNTTFLNGTAADALIIGTSDLLTLGLQSAGSASAVLGSRTVVMDNSRLVGLGGSDLVGLEGITELRFAGLGTSQRADLSFHLLAEGLKDSGILLGQGNDTVTVNSGFYVSGIDPLAAEGQGGFNFDLGQAPLSRGDGSNWRFNLNARAVGLDNSLIDTGAGDDRVSIFTRIDENLVADLGVLYDDPFTSIQLERIGLLNSTVLMGDGNDELRINGSLIDSTIDLGSGNNTLILEGPMLGSTRILMGDGTNSINFNDGLGGQVQGGSNDDRFNLRNQQLVGELDGGGGNDILVAPTGANSRRELLVLNGPDAGNLDGLRFRSIESVDLGGGDDVTLLDLGGSLTGQLLGGNGLDRLEYSNWTLPVSVDLDRGSATGIGAGASGSLVGFEVVRGGLGNDSLTSSGAFLGIDGGGGDDVLYLRWSPWLSAGDTGLQVKGGSGRDLFVISGLEQGTPLGWDGQRGIPQLVDLDLSFNGTSSGIGITDAIGWVRTQTLPGGESQQSFERLTPSGLAGIGDARLLPIAPLEQLLAGMGSNTQQLAIATDGGGGGQLYLLGSQGQGTAQLVAGLPSDLLSQVGTTSSGSPGSTP
jgi:hypothetical protein